MSTLLDYFSGKIALQEVARAAKARVKLNESSMSITQFDAVTEPYTLSSLDLIRLCDDALIEQIEEADLAMIAFWIFASDGFEWDSGSEDGAVVAETISNWSSPEIDYRITPASLKQFRSRLVHKDLSIPIEK